MAAAAPELGVRLGEPHWRDRKAAAESLGALGDAAAVAIAGIARRLEDHNALVRQAAASALGDLSEADVWGRTPSQLAESAVPELVTRLADADINVRRAAKAPLDALKDTGRLGDLGRASAPAVAELSRRLSDEDWMLREASAKALGSLGAVAAPAIPDLLAAVADESLQVRRAAKAALERLCQTGDVGDLRSFGAPAALRLQARLQHKDWRVRCAAAWALGTSGGPAAVGACRLAQALDPTEESHVQSQALEALTTFGGAAAPALPEVIMRMFDDDDDVKDVATIVFRAYLQERSEGTAVQVPELLWLLRKLADQDPNVRKDAADSLGELGAAATPALRSIVAAAIDDDFDASLAASNAVQRLRDAGVLGSFADGATEAGPKLCIRDALLARLKDEHWAVSLHAAEALAKLLAMAATVCVRIVMRAEDDRFRGPEQVAAQRLRKMLTEEGAMMELGEIMDEVLPVLSARLGEDEPRPVREQALSALELLQDMHLLEDPAGRLTAVALSLRGRETR